MRLVFTIAFRFATYRMNGPTTYAVYRAALTVIYASDVAFGGPWVIDIFFKFKYKDKKYYVEFDI